MVRLFWPMALFTVNFSHLHYNVIQPGCEAVSVENDKIAQKTLFAKIVKLILYSKLAQNFFDLIKSSNFYAPSKPSFK